MDGDRFGGLHPGVGNDPPPSSPPTPGGLPAQGGYPRRRDARRQQHVAAPDDPQHHPGQPYDPEQYPPQDPAPPLAWQVGPTGDGPGESPRGGPSVRVVVTTLGITALVAVLAGGVYGLLRPVPATVTTTVATTSMSAQAATTARTTPPATASVTKPAPSTASAAPRQTAYVEDPAGTAGMDFGVLTGVERSGSALTVTMDRAQFLTGAKAVAYYAGHPDEEPLDYAVVNTNQRLRTFTVTEDAAVYAQFALGDGGGVKTEQISLDQFYEKAVGLLATDQSLLLWLRHVEGPDGPVYYLAEQYTP